ncbi:double-strand break repair helicase AddA [Pontixanthobacter aestiaquae]|uniref:DNA 3'-5' helicase n=1 Tax=Pontixanthobacter aestiaquae TaxID=1509367 RepID=A0A844Z6G4_9SPHN|nr:double-strand break repair helicase AddA [Pontixanthobacter aestiaquae]MDN3645605.1 double-strand break repair helicase AddA [Pontixanthobacter aestiaquae]MXO83398.1 double-strand break repair helicase AddA [Pontixanthobacter aestiaquae]
MSASKNQGRVFQLKDNQALAVDPEESVWLSASAGTGKTQVLSARVLRLLLRRDVDPSQILCLTFTKAGAAEMATRVNEVLANWVRMKPEVLAADLQAIGASVDSETQSRARSLFASVLDCPGGGLRIDTIHAFAQWLLAAFPEEAGLSPGSRAMEDRDRDVLAHKVLADMVVDWQDSGETGLLDALSMLSIRMGADGARGWLMRCAKAREVWFGKTGWQDDLGGRVRRLLGLAEGAGPDDVAALCADSEFAISALQRCAAVNAEWGTKTGLKSADAIALWLAATPAQRVDLASDMAAALFTQKGDPRSLKSLEKIDPGYADAAAEVMQSLSAVRELQMRLALSEWLTPALRIGRRFALRWDEAKKREGLIDFDDQIRRAAALLSRSDIADWIRYKLDRQFDHILIDEAQDTNEAQWSIIRALTEDYFVGEGQRDGKLRTIFVVGDYKQAIFRFQGTSPENFEISRKHFAKVMADAADNADTLRDRIDARPLKSLDLGRSYRTAQPVLDFVDHAIDRIGFEQFGLAEHPGKHIGQARSGEVVLWSPVSAQADDEDEAEGSDTWLSEPERRMADKIAGQVTAWLRDGYPLVKGDTPRNAGPGDIMILVRKRKELAGLIVARLHAAGVPVAGVDRLRLGAPLAVKDLMAALRFAAQPLDDLSLANLLVSPLIGWSQEDLLQHGYRVKGIHLWDHLRKSDAPLAAATADRLRDLLRLTDYEPPQALLHWLLIGPWKGRTKLVSRLGREANDPIDELLNAALAFSSAHTASLQGFIQWFDAGESELKREAGASEGLVRVMTVHGSKGLQAPIVILADATGNPDSSPVRSVSLSEEVSNEDTKRSVPIPSLRKDEKVGPVLAAEDAIAREERQEHWRLLYVAMTRAEEALFIGGALGQREDVPADDSWYARLAPLFPEEIQDDPNFGARRAVGQRPPAAPLITADKPLAALPDIPDWAATPIGPEPRPPRPLAPSSAGEDQAADPPLSGDSLKIAARRGVLIHSLLERLPDVAQSDRHSRAKAWLSKHAGDLDTSTREEVLAAAMKVLREPGFETIFGPEALAEVPLAATVDGQVIAGIADRLLVTPESVTVVDFKTARRPPASLDAVPAASIRQMAAYAAALAEIYPERAIKAALLYTQSPQLIEIPSEVLAANKSTLSTKQESFPA